MTLHETVYFEHQIMSMIIAALLLIVHHVSGETQPAPTHTLWGSRVVSIASGPSDTMVFDVALTGPRLYALVDGTSELTEVAFDVTNKNCFMLGTLVADPCIVEGEKLTIQATDVTKQRAFVISNPSDPLIAVFAPDCKFPETKSGDVDLATSIPYSRFAKNKNVLELNFAVGNATLDTQVQLYRNQILLCLYKGIVPMPLPTGYSCPTMVRDASTDMRRLTINLTKLADKETFAWQTSTSVVSVSVDWTQEGESGECKEAATTSAASAVIYGMGVNIALLVILLFFRK